MCYLRSNEVFPPLEDSRIAEAARVEFDGSGLCSLREDAVATGKKSKPPILFEGDVSTLLVAKIHNKTPKFTVDHDMVDLLLRTFITSKCTVDHHIVDTIRCSLSVSRKPAFLAGPALE